MRCLQPQTHCGVFRAQETCLVAANVVLFQLSEIEIEANVALFEYTIRYRIVAC